MFALRSRHAVLGAAFALGIGGVLESLAGPRDAAAAERQRPLPVDVERGSARLDEELAEVLARKHFKGDVGSTLETRLGRKVDPVLADLGRNLFFDPILSLRADNACAGCHSPANGFGDTQPIAIGVQNNGIVGPNRTGPRNKRRAPMLLNTAFFPKLMLDGRFSSPVGDPFDNRFGFAFPPPEGRTKFGPNDPRYEHLLVAQAHIPPTDQVELAGFTGSGGPFDDGLGHVVPPPDASGFRNEPIRRAVLKLLNESPGYRELFSRLFPQVAEGAPISFEFVARAIAEFEFTLVFANAPIDRFARGERRAMTASQKRGALLFFDDATFCSGCHTVSGRSNEMFSDFEVSGARIPQIAPVYGVGTGNVEFSGPGKDEDLGLAEITREDSDRYQFRTSPLRNVALQAAFFHNGAFTRLEDAIRFHANSNNPGGNAYDPAAAGLPPDLQRTGPRAGELDPSLAGQKSLTDAELADLVAFLRDGLLDERAKPENLMKLIPAELPSGLPPLVFESPAP